MIVVAGIPYSGTTMLVGMLEGLGVHMLDPATSDLNTGEDRLMGSLRGDEYVAEAKRREAKYGLCGYKDPVAFKHRNFEAHDHKLILIFRDPVAMLDSKGQSALTDIEVNFSSVAAAYQWGLEKRALMLSYEKTLLFPERTIEKLVKFIGVDVTKKKTKDLAAQVKPENGYRGDDGR